MFLTEKTASSYDFALASRFYCVITIYNSAGSDMTSKLDNLGNSTKGYVITKSSFITVKDIGKPTTTSQEIKAGNSLTFFIINNGTSL